MQQDDPLHQNDLLKQNDLQLALVQEPNNHQPIQIFGQIDARLQLALLQENINHQPIQAIIPIKSDKRKSRKRPTPVVDDEVKRSTRLHKILGFVHMELDEKSKPRKLTKEDTILMEEQLNQALEEAMSDDQMLPIEFMQNLATNYCGVAPEDVTVERLLSNDANDNNA